MKTDKVHYTPKTKEKSLVTGLQSFLKKYANNCRYSFNRMLNI